MMRLLSFLMLLVMPWTALAQPYTEQSSMDTVQYYVAHNTHPGCYVYPTTFDVADLDTVTELEDPTLPVEDILVNYPETVFEISSWVILDWGIYPVTTTDWLDAGTLHYGFKEALHSPNAQRNGILEVNDIPQRYNDSTSNFDRDYSAAIESHISNQTLMILPAVNLNYRISKFVTVRALEYNSTTDTIKLALVDSNANYSCINVPTTAKMKQQIHVDAYTSLYNSVVSYSWSWGDGTPHTQGRQSQHTYTLPGTYHIQLTIQYADGSHKLHNQSIRITQDHFGPTDCFVYPLTFHEAEILGINELPNPTLTVAQIYNYYPDTIFQVHPDPDMGHFNFLAWIQEYQSTDRMWGNGGSLGYGFQEASSTNVEQINGSLESGDFIAALTGHVRPVSSFFDYHITNKTIMIFPLYNQRAGFPPQFHISRFVAVRFLDYVLSPSNQRSLTFALVEDNAAHACFSSAGHIFAGNPNIVTPRTPLNQELAHMWNLGDGTTTTIRDVSHVYTQTGIYSVTLTTTNTSNFVAQAFGSVTVEDPIMLNLAASSHDILGSASTISATLADFADSARVLTYTVSWGDDSPPEPFTVTAETTTTLELTHTYPTIGVYTPTMTVMSPQGAMLVRDTSMVVYNIPRIAVDSSAPDTLGQTTTLTATFEPDLLTDVFSYTVDWGDATTMVFSETTASTVTQVLSHAYQTAGIYTATITTHDYVGLPVTTTEVLTIDSIPEVIFHAQQAALTTWNFTATVTGTAPFSYTWNWGDGTEPLVTNSPTATHTFTQAGTYTVTLTVTGANGWQVEQEYVVEVILQRVFLPMLRR